MGNKPNKLASPGPIQEPIDPAMLRIFQELEGKTDANRKNQQFNINEDFDLGFISRSITYNYDEAIPRLCHLLRRQAESARTSQR